MGSRKGRGKGRGGKVMRGEMVEWYGGVGGLWEWKADNGHVPFLLSCRNVLLHLRK